MEILKKIIFWFGEYNRLKDYCSNIII